MIKLIRVAIGLLILTGSFKESANGKKPLPMKYKWAMIQLNDSLLVMETEVTVSAWLSFYSWHLKNKQMQRARLLLPDKNLVPPAVWELFENRMVEYNKSRTQSGFPVGFYTNTCDNYICPLDTVFHHTSKRKQKECLLYRYPITGITYEQATWFCRWLSEERGDGVVEYRLPTEKEWAYIVATSIGQVLAPDSIDKKGRMRYNYHCETGLVPIKDYKNVHINTAYPVAYYDDEGYFYDLFGNVSEMVKERGISKGGSYVNTAVECCADHMQIYSKPEKWLGFRVVGVIDERFRKLYK